MDDISHKIVEEEKENFIGQHQNYKNYDHKTTGIYIYMKTIL